MSITKHNQLIAVHSSNSAAVKIAVGRGTGMQKKAVLGCDKLYWINSARKGSHQSEESFSFYFVPGNLITVS